jgi:hypothetical protein
MMFRNPDDVRSRNITEIGNVTTGDHVYLRVISVRTHGEHPDPGVNGSVVTTALRGYVDTLGSHPSGTAVTQHDPTPGRSEAT